MHLNPADFNSISWRGPSIDDEEILARLPVTLFEVLREINGFILHRGALHVRGACTSPPWHSLRHAWLSENAMYRLYHSVTPQDIPFAQDLFGDQFLLRDGAVSANSRQTAELERMADDLDEFWNGIETDFSAYLNVNAGELNPGELVLAYPPFCVEESEANIDFSKIPAFECIQFHANLARQLKDVPEGAKIKFNIP